MLLCTIKLQGELMYQQTAGTLYLETPRLHCLPRREFQHWLWQVGVLQRAFPNSALELDNVVRTADAANINRLLNCTELRNVTICPTSKPVRRAKQWQAIAALGRLHGGRLQLQVAGLGALLMLEAEPSLAAHILQAELPCSADADAGRSLAEHVSSLSNLTKLTLRNQESVLGEAGMLDALRQLSGLQSLYCLPIVMRRLLVRSVPSSWPLLTELQLDCFSDGSNDPDWALVEQQCPQLQALSMHKATPLCLTALTSLTCDFWRPQDRQSFQCSRLGHLYVKCRFDLNLLPSTLTSLSLYSGPGQQLNAQHLGRQQSLVHICFTSPLKDLSDIQGLVSGIHPALSFVTSVKLTIHPRALFPPDMAGQHFHHLGACFVHLQRVHIHLHGRRKSEEVLISAAWLPADCSLVVTHKLKCPVRIVKCPSGCLSLPLSSWPETEWI